MKVDKTTAAAIFAGPFAGYFCASMVIQHGFVPVLAVGLVLGGACLWAFDLWRLGR